MRFAIALLFAAVSLAAAQAPPKSPKSTGGFPKGGAGGLPKGKGGDLASILEGLKGTGGPAPGGAAGAPDFAAILEGFKNKGGAAGAPSSSVPKVPGAGAMPKGKAAGGHSHGGF